MKMFLVLIICLIFLGCGTASDNVANYHNWDKEKYAEWFIQCVGDKDSDLTAYGCEIYGKKMYCEYVRPYK